METTAINATPIQLEGIRKALDAYVEDISRILTHLKGPHQNFLF